MSEVQTTTEEVVRLRAQVAAVESIERQMRHVGNASSLMPYPELRRTGREALAVANLLRDALATGSP